MKKLEGGSLDAKTRGGVTSTVNFPPNRGGHDNLVYEFWQEVPKLVIFGHVSQWFSQFVWNMKEAEAEAYYINCHHLDFPRLLGMQKSRCGRFILWPVLRWSQGVVTNIFGVKFGTVKLIGGRWFFAAMSAQIIQMMTFTQIMMNFSRTAERVYSYPFVYIKWSISPIHWIIKTHRQKAWDDGVAPSDKIRWCK